MGDEVVPIYNHWRIPSLEDVAENSPVRIQMILNIQGGTMPGGGAYLLQFHQIELQHFGQLEMSVGDESQSPHHQTLETMTDEGWRDRYLNFKLEGGLLVPESGEHYHQEVRSF